MSALMLQATPAPMRSPRSTPCKRFSAPTGSLEQPAGRCRIPPRGYEHIDDLAKLVDRTRHRATGRRPPPTSGPPASGPNATLARAGGVSRQRRERGTQQSTVTWSASMPRSASSSSTSRYDRPKRRYQRTAGTIRSRPVEAKAGNGRACDGGGRGRRVVMAAVSLLGRGRSEYKSALTAPTTGRVTTTRARRRRPGVLGVLAPRLPADPLRPPQEPQVGPSVVSAGRSRPAPRPQRPCR
jgi:hypothetical protein